MTDDGGKVKSRHPANRCLCCGQLHYGKSEEQRTPLQFAAELSLLEQLGYTRDNLLADHRAQLDYQLPGMATWLEGQ
jgi:hypothetical protein